MRWPADVVHAWLETLPGDATAEQVRDGFWYVRLPGAARRWIPLEIEVGQRTVKVTSHVIVEPEERAADVYRLLLRHNMDAKGVAFAIDGREAVICLVGRIALASFDESALDGLVARIVEATEATFRSILTIGFGSRMGRARP